MIPYPSLATPHYQKTLSRGHLAINEIGKKDQEFCDMDRSGAI